MHLPTLPCSAPVEIHSLLGFSSKFSTSSSCSLFLISLICLAALLAVVSLRFVLLRRSKPVTLVRESKLQTSEKESPEHRRTWRNILNRWDAVNLPVTLTAPASSAVVGHGVGLNGAVLEKPMSPPIRSGPTFEQPLPAIYQSKEPLSMAKLIMSRHTFRRPSQSQRVSLPRRSTAPASGSRPQSMV
jgi:hypothetical protein